MREDMAYILLDRETIARRVREMGALLSRDYAGKRPLMICVLKGSVVFFADLIRAMDIPVELEFMTASSYGSATVSSGEVKVVSSLDDKIRDRNVILVEDIIDSGRTIAYVKADMLTKGVESLKVVALLDKPSRRESEVKPDYSGFEVPDAFVVGYGLDYDEKYRNLPDIGVLHPRIYTK
jgi:hypoxanthine phosphoribosyltransferase